MTTSLTLLRYAEELAVVRLDPGADVPDWATGSTLLSVTATADETSVVCSAGVVPDRARSQGPFTAYAVRGPLDFSLTGLLHRLLTPLAEEQVSVFTLSTFDTDWILVPAADADRAAARWQRDGHHVAPAAEQQP